MRNPLAILADFLIPDRNPGAPRLWCRAGLHRWCPGTGYCEECGIPDRLQRPQEFNAWVLDMSQRCRGCQKATYLGPWPCKSCGYDACASTEEES